MTAEDLRRVIAGEETRGVHGPQRGPVSITQITERGTIYALDDLRGLCAVAKEYDLPVHLDGARFANALVELGCSPAEMTWKAGVDVVSFGGTKNGLMGQRPWSFRPREGMGIRASAQARRTPVFQATLSRGAVPALSRRRALA